MPSVTYTVETLDAIIEREMHNYRCELNSLRIRLDEADHRVARGRVSTHDGYNISASAGKLQECAAKIELLLQIRAEATDACPGCGSQPGDGPKVGCIHPDGCGAHLVVDVANGVWSLKHTGSGTEFYGGRIGAEMYDRLTRQRQTPETIATEMSARYGVDVERIRIDLSGLISTMQGK